MQKTKTYKRAPKGHRRHQPCKGLGCKACEGKGYTPNLKPDTPKSQAPGNGKSKPENPAEPSSGGKGALLDVERMDLLDLVPAEYNPREISSSALDGLGASIDRFGLVQPVVFNRRTQRIVGGHQRVKAMEAKGITQTDVVVVDVPEEEEKAMNLALNSPQISGSFTAGALPLLEEVSLSLPELAAELKLPELGADLAKMFPKPQEDLPDDEAPEPPADPVTKTGDVWLLGKHRLVCGDSTSKAAVLAMKGHSPFMMVTDPPYGVEYDPAWRTDPRLGHVSSTGSKSALGAVSNDDRVDWSAAYNRFSGDVAYVWHGGKACGELWMNLTAEGFEIRAQIIWAKSKAPISRGAYHWGHEPCWYAVRKGKTARWSGDRKQSTIWKIDINRKNETGHSTQKPVECMGRPMRNHGQPGDVIYDPFLGSGTTIIAAEQLDRICVGLELDPAYCDVVVERWQQLTGGKARKE